MASRDTWQMQRDIERWNALIDRYEKADKKTWKKEMGDIHLPVMQIPQVLQLLGAPRGEIKIFGSFFGHAVRKDHPGMTLDTLRQIPEGVIDPLMITKGSKPNSYVFGLELQDANGATVVVALELNKAILGEATNEHFFNSAYGKTEWGNRNVPSYIWFLKKVENREVLYLNKNKSIAYFRSCGNDSPVASEVCEALSELIVSEDMKNVKTEEDLKIFPELQKGRNGKTRYSWYSEQIERGNLLYAHKEKAVQFLTSAGVQFPMEEQTNSFLTYIVKTDEDLVKFHQQKEEEKVMAKLITPQEEERKKNMMKHPKRDVYMETTEKQEQSEVNHDLSDAYFEEISKSLEYAEPPLTEEEYEELQSGAKELHGAMRNLEEAEHVAGPDQEAWDEYASRHNDIKEKIEQASDAREDGASEEECKVLVADAKTAMQHSTDFFKERYEALLERQRAYEEQMQALKDQVEEMQKQIAASGALAQGVGMCPYANYAHCMASSVQFLKQMEKMRQEAATQPRPIASALFKATREFASDAYHAVRFAPVKLKDMLVRKVHEKVDNLLFRVAGSFDDKIQSLEKTRNSILSHAHEFKTAAEFYQDAAAEEAKQHGEGRVDLMAERRIADKMAIAGFGAYTIEKTILANSSNAEEMKKGIAHDFAKKAEESAKKHQNENKKQDKNVR